MGGPIASLMSVAASGSEYSQAMSMAGGNCIQAQVLGVNLGSATSFTVTLQGSNDLQSWTDIVAWTNQLAGNNYPARQLAVTYAFVRLKVAPVGGGPVTLVANLHKSAQ